ncbi:hypothetical protein [Marinomonas sp. IMCC 4694]|uniref:hypothetical protein n=1 Tax=Marinomonas sp. IMCC 4694 TaxID=2605432 RepID=UPI0011E61359|nr:hypothetical protein [Marinomonas sp. IMCC 4694]TYL49013.1 hypothetical protein FXV75_14415 [Marinomonas sp. IMCC 4694]
MFLSQSLKDTKRRWFKAARLISVLRRLNNAIVVLLIVLQLAAWYPALSIARQAWKNSVTLEKKAHRDWLQIQQQDEALEHAVFDAAPWLHHRIESTQAGIATHWLVEGTAPLLAWQTVLEDVQTRFALTVSSVSWRREEDGNWQARLVFHVLTPAPNREYRDWVPVRLHVERFVKDDWQLLSTMQAEGTTSALLLYKKQRYWVQVGSWLPEAGLTVSRVSFDDVVFMGDDGTQRALSVREIGGLLD